MYYELSILIKRYPEDAFIFLRDKDKHTQKENSPVLILEKTTEGPVRVGTRYREVVQMLPFYKGEIISTLTNYDPPRCLEEDFSGSGMKGHLAYQFLKRGTYTELIQRQKIEFIFPLNLLDPLIKKILQRKLVNRLNEIKLYLESRLNDALVKADPGH
jgi:hypothetical protein